MRTANKVAAVTALFWLMKIVATTLGETLGDFISMTLNLGYTTGILVTLSFFLIILSLQFKLKEYVPAVYWMVIIGTTTLGTEISDFIDRTLKAGYLAGSLILVTGLLTSLFLWYKNTITWRFIRFLNVQKSFIIGWLYCFPIAWERHSEIF